MSNGVNIYGWDELKKFASDYDLVVYAIEYSNRYDVAVYVGGVRHFYVMDKRETTEVAELQDILSTQKT